MYELRNYQREAINAVMEDWNGAERFKNTLLVLPTGTGKTIVFANIAKNRTHAGRVLILAHSDVLIKQAADKLYKVTGLNCAVEKAEQTCIGSTEPIVIGSRQTLGRADRLNRFSSDYFSTIIIDEAHHCLSPQYRAIIDRFPNANLLGVTATPDRGDRKSLGQVFDHLAYEYTIRQAVDEGYLCQIRAQMIPLNIDFTDVKTSHGDYVLDDIDTALDPYLERIAYEMQKYCRGRKTVVFLPLIRTSQRFADMLRKRNFNAVEVNGNSDNRDEILKDFEAGKYDVLCNAMLLTEGWDCPSVDCIVVLRPTKVRSLYVQMVGRGTRPAKGKDHLLLLDFLWNTERHDLCRPAHLVASTDEIADKVMAELESADGSIDLNEANMNAERDVAEEREQALAKRLEKMRNNRRKLVDPLQYAASISAEDLLNYEPTFAWETAPITDLQKTAIEGRGIDTNELDRGKASKLISHIKNRDTGGYATPKQIRILERYGYRRVGEWQNAEASKIIGDEIVAYNYKPWTTKAERAAYVPPSLRKRRFEQAVNE